MDRNLGPTGIEGLGDLPGGTHFCLFYETKQDLLDILTGYFKAGFENHECCLWITADSAVEEASNTLKQFLPEANQHLNAGDLEILTFQQWYLKEEKFNTPQVISGFTTKLAQAVGKGYTGVRGIADEAWLGQEDWKAFADYESQLDGFLANKPIIVLCAYPTMASNAAEVLDIARSHNFAAAKLHGKWEILETPELKHAKREFQRNREEPKQQANESIKSGSLWPLGLPSILSYSFAVLSTILATIISMQMESDLGTAAHVSLYLCAVLFSSWFGGAGSGLLTLALSSLAFDYFFLLPVNSLAIETAQLPRLVLFVLASLFVIALSAEQRSSFESLRHVRDDLKKNNQALQAEIIEHKQAETALRESEAKLEEAQQLANIGYWENDLIADRITGSEGTYRIFGLKPEEGALSQGKLQRMIYPDDRQIQQGALSEALKGSRLYDVEYRIIRPDGDIRFLHVRDEIEYDTAGQPIRIFGALQDITERKQAEEFARLQAARAQLLADISKSFAEAGLDYQAVLNTITRRTAELIGDSCMILALSQTLQRLRPVAFHHPDPLALAMMQKILTNARTGSLDTPISERVLAGDPVRLPLVTVEEIGSLLSSAYQPFVDRVGISSLLAVPMRIQGRVIGIISLSRDRPGRPYTGGDQILLQDIADRAALTVENARLFQSAAQQGERLRELSAQLMEARETERRSIARELHDEIGQILSGLMLQLGMAKSHLPKSARSTQTFLEGAEGLIQATLEQLRAIIAGLRPQVLDDLGLIPALRRLANEFQEDTGAKVEIKTDNLPDRLPAPMELALFRIVQEGLTNVRKHAQAHSVNILLEKEDGQVILFIRDDGRGFEGQPAGMHPGDEMGFGGGPPASEGHFGLTGIQERAAQLGGRAQITSAPWQGTTLRVELPLVVTQAGSNES